MPPPVARPSNFAIAREFFMQLSQPPAATARAACSKTMPPPMRISNHAFTRGAPPARPFSFPKQGLAFRAPTRLLSARSGVMATHAGAPPRPTALLKRLQMPQPLAGHAGGHKEAVEVRRAPATTGDTGLAQLDLAGLLQYRDQAYAARERIAGEAPSPEQRERKQAATTQLHAIVREAVQRRGFWNDGIADLIPQIMHRTALWPADTALRIIDPQHGGIQYFSRDYSAHRYDAKPGASPAQKAEMDRAPLLPEPKAGEITLIRERVSGGGDHFRLILADHDQLIHDVAEDGDCFFSCISKARGVSDAETAASNRRLRQSVAQLLADDPELMEQAAAMEPPRRRS